MKYKKYPKYKNSRIEWLGEIPEHWEVIKLKYVSDIIPGFAFKSNEFKEKSINTVPVIRIGNLDIKGKINLENAKYINDKYVFSHSQYLVKKNDILMAMTGATVGKTAKYIFDKESLLNQRVCLIRTKKNFLQQDLFYISQSKFFKDFIFIYAFGSAQDNISDETLKNFFIPFPPLQEQKEIAFFLDKQIEKIDTLIKKEEELIKLLEEKKEALITKAVTKGLNSNVKMKESGIEWLGEIPEHWEVRKIYHLFKKIGSGTTPSSNKTEYYENGNIFWLQTGDLTDSYINETSKKINEKALKDFSSLKIYSPNSLVIAMYGATVGKLGILNICSTTNQACCVLSDYKYEIIKYVFYLFLGIRKHIISLSYGGGQPNISQETIKNLKIPLPPLQEQKEIANYLDKKLSQIDKLIKKSKKAIELLKEKKESLITNAVTGKIDVRNCDEA